MPGTQKVLSTAGECSDNKGKDDGGSAGVASAPRTGSDWERVKAPLGSWGFIYKQRLINVSWLSK